MTWEEMRNVKHTIETEGSQPIRVPHRRLPHHQRENIRTEIEAMLMADVIEPSNSPWSAPVVMVKKKDGSLRFCIDYRKLNQVTKRDVFPLPRCDEILEAMSGAAFFTHLDLVRGYWQIDVDEASREKTAFSTPEGHFQFKRMPFGLTNAPASFQRAMNSILHGLNWKDCLVYLDDVIIFAKNLEEHNRRLDSVLERLEDAGVKLNAAKCQFLQEKTTFLGHVVSREGVTTDPEKTKALLQYPEPSDVSSLRSFFGCAGYYRHFVQNFAEIAAPLYNLEKKGTVFHWTKQCQEAFDTLKHRLTNPPILAYPRFDSPFIVDTDASDTGLGAVLSQIQEGKERVIAYAAKALTKPQRNYSTTRKELLALVWGLEHFEVYLLGRRFRARTDHNALRWLRSFKEPKGQVARWIERLAEFDFTIEHRPGRLHGNADALSRSLHQREPNLIINQATGLENPPPITCSTAEKQKQQSWLSYWKKSDIELHQKEDPDIFQTLEWMKAGTRPKREEIVGTNPTIGNLWSQFDRLRLEDGLLCREYETEDGTSSFLQLCLPRKLVSQVLQLLHDSPTSGHLGVQKTSERVQARYYWKGWRQDVEDHCRSCKKCGERNAPGKLPRARLGTCPSGYPMERVAMDVVGPLPKTNRGNRFILVINDYFTKWPEAYTITKQKRLPGNSSRNGSRGMGPCNTFIPTKDASSKARSSKPCVECSA